LYLALPAELCLRRGMTRTTAAGALAPVLAAFVGEDAPIRVLFWDSSVIEADTNTTLVIHSPRALRRLLYAPGELGLARAYVAGDIDIEGDLQGVFSLAERYRDSATLARPPRQFPPLVRAARKLGIDPRPLCPPPEEARISGRSHSPKRDRAAISHHYDVSNDFYKLVLGDSLTYSCAFFARDGMSLEEAQSAKHDLVCRKLGLRSGMRLLDVGCGWGEMVAHAAENYGVRAVGVTLSERQHELASKRIAEGGLADRVEIRLQDYRSISDGPYDAISSIGMFEHVGARMLDHYFATLYGLVREGGRVLNHGISRPPGRTGVDRRSFVARYVFPDGELHEVGAVVSAMQERGFEVRDVESLREHYARTLKAWVTNLERNWDEAVRLTSEGRARVWRLYMSGSAAGFEAGRISIHQVLGVRPDAGGGSGMPPTREWLIEMGNRPGREKMNPARRP
jgi:cyclopropane-fatty-acyl-phospholipid synthase